MFLAEVGSSLPGQVAPCLVIVQYPLGSCWAGGSTVVARRILGSSRERSQV